MTWYACACGLVWEVVGGNDEPAICLRCREDGTILPGDILAEMLER